MADHSRLPFRILSAGDHGNIRIVDAGGSDIGYATTLDITRRAAERNASLLVDGANSFYAMAAMRTALRDIAAGASNPAVLARNALLGIAETPKPFAKRSDWVGMWPVA